MTETFNFPFHSIEEAFPETGYSVKFGQSYEFRTGSSAPDQVVYTLNMSGLRYYQNPDKSFNRTVNPTTNILFFKDFYKAHKLHVPFYYNHEAEGQLRVRFKDPIKIPTAFTNSNGVIPTFSITLELMP